MESPIEAIFRRSDLQVVNIGSIGSAPKFQQSAVVVAEDCKPVSS